jgi:hypothetical protein
MANLSLTRERIRDALARQARFARDEGETTPERAEAIVKKLQEIFKARLSKEERAVVIQLLLGRDTDVPDNLKGETPHPTVDADLPENAIARAAFDSRFPSAARISSGGGYAERPAAPAFSKAPRSEHLDSFARMFPNAARLK